MSLGNKSEVCAVCGKKVNILNRTKLTDGFLCSTCKTWCSNFVQIGSMSSADVRTHISKTLQDDAIYSTLVPTESVGIFKRSSVELYGLERREPISFFL